jgi:heme/copper-type cytochrome/quinol oxidase subunit 3
MNMNDNGNKNKKRIHPLLIVFITVSCVLFLTFLIFYFDWWRDYEPDEPIRYIGSSNYMAGVRNNLHFNQPSGLFRERLKTV